MSSSKLIFVYNSTSGPLQAIKDFAHKSFQPSTYQCKLCAVTYSGAFKKRDWKRFLKSLELPYTFLYVDTFKKKYPNTKLNAPAIFIERGRSLYPLANAGDFKNVHNLDDLKHMVTDRL